MSPRDRSTNRLLMNSDQLELMDRSLEQQAIEQSNDAASEARRTEYLERLRAALPELRKLEGFPIGSDEDILALSDPPYYTACPNPFLADFIAEHGTVYDEATDDYHREPFAADVSEGKNDPIYNAHSYHTKVPHKAIMRYILHYTKPGDVVFDGFCGTGMTGVAAQLCGSPDPDFRATVEAEWAATGHPKPEWGARYAVLGDLSPAATFIAYNYNSPINAKTFKREAERILDEVEAELGWMYATPHSDGSTGRINYVVWSEVLLCPGCGAEVVWWSATVDEIAKLVNTQARCPDCGSRFSKEEAGRATVTVVDPVVGSLRQGKSVPVVIDYDAAGRRWKKQATSGDVPSVAYPAVPIAVRMPDGDEGRRNDGVGVTHAHHYLTPRNLTTVLAFWRRIDQVADCRLRLALKFLLTGMLRQVSRLAKVGTTYYLNGGGGAVNAGLLGTLYLPSFSAEVNPLQTWQNRSRRIGEALAMAAPARSSIVTTQSALGVDLGVESVDYVFLDPPFGSNISYSDLNVLWEAWLGVRTQAEQEAIVSRRQHRSLPEYQALMEAAFERAYRALKCGRWMTVEFHNSSNAVWNAIQVAIQRAGFVMADVRVLDKGGGTFKSVTSAGAVKQDLVISAYKPRMGFEHRFALEAGTEQGTWEFVREHLGQLPVFVENKGRVEVVAERQNYLLFDRMVAFHIQRGATVPFSAGQFYAGLHHRFLERDDMYFTELQAAAYDRRRLEAPDIEQMSVFVFDEKSARQWIRAELLTRPQTFQDLQPKFLRELNQNRYEELPELRDILEQGFLEDPDTHRWRVPDPGKQADLEALRQRGLLTEFATYLPGSSRLKRFRIEAVRAGFADLWAKRAYAAIIAMAERLPDEVVQEDPALLMYYDNAVTREGAG